VESLEFPGDGGGSVIFQRDEFIKETVEMVLQKDTNENNFLSYYWRAPHGSGKTVFLKLMGKELQSRGCDVYSIFLAGSLEGYRGGYFKNLCKNAGTRTVVLLIDDVHHNTNSSVWDGLLKSHRPNNLLVLGVGLTKINVSPQFKKQFPRQRGELIPMFLTPNDLPEICTFFKAKYKYIPDEVIKKSCQTILYYTSGQIFPFVSILEYLFTSQPSTQTDNIATAAIVTSAEAAVDVTPLPAYNVALDDLGMFLISPKFSKSLVKIIKRCSYHLNGHLLTAAENTLKGKIEYSVHLERIGLLHDGKLISPLFDQVLFQNSIILPTTKIELVDSKITPYAQQVICAGLRDMTEQDFLDFSNIAVENAIGFRWGYNVRCTLPNVWIAPQIRMESFDDMGIRKSWLSDFLFNGKLNLGIELVLNSTDGTLKSHLNRFDAAYKAMRGNGFVFDIQTRKDTISDDVTDRVYTFLKTRNELYRGSKLIQRNVASIQTPHHIQTTTTKIGNGRNYSTLAFNLFRKML
jgi:hypothetical protein